MQRVIRHACGESHSPVSVGNATSLSDLSLSETVTSESSSLHEMKTDGSNSDGPPTEKSRALCLLLVMRE